MIIFIASNLNAERRTTAVHYAFGAHTVYTTHLLLFLLNTIVALEPNKESQKENEREGGEGIEYLRTLKTQHISMNIEWTNRYRV